MENWVPDYELKQEIERLLAAGYQKISPEELERIEKTGYTKNDPF